MAAAQSHYYIHPLQERDKFPSTGTPEGEHRSTALSHSPEQATGQGYEAHN